MNTKETIQFYNENRDIFRNHLMQFTCYQSIYDIVTDREVNDNVLEVISAVSIEAYLKDETGLSLTRICDTLSEFYNRNEVNLSEMEKAGKWMILDSIINESPKYLF